MSPFEVLHGKKCNVPIQWDNPVDRLKLGTHMLKDFEHMENKAKKNLKIAQDKQKMYSYLKRFRKEFNVGDHIFLKVKPKKSSLRVGTYAKLTPRFCGTFQVLAWIGPISYELALSTSINILNVFHVSFLKKYVHDPTHIICWNVIRVELEGYFQA